MLKNGTIMHLDIESKKLKTKVRSHVEEVIDFIANEYYIISISKDRTIRIWDAINPPYI